MTGSLRKLGSDLGAIGLASLAVIAVSIAFSIAFVRPLEQRKADLERQAQSAARAPSPDRLLRVRSAGAAGQFEAFYRYFDKRERTDEWLAKLYGIATASGVALRSGDYRLADSRQRIERYQINLPVSGTYAQIRAFTEGALAEIPVLSLDQIAFRRKNGNDGRVDAEIVLTLHVLRK